MDPKEYFSIHSDACIYLGTVVEEFPFTNTGEDIQRLHHHLITFICTMLFHGQQPLAFSWLFFFGLMYGVPPFSATRLQFLLDI
jgi:hypothetical protein